MTRTSKGTTPAKVARRSLSDRKRNSQSAPKPSPGLAGDSFDLILNATPVLQRHDAEFVPASLARPTPVKRSVSERQRMVRVGQIRMHQSTEP